MNLYWNFYKPYDTAFFLESIIRNYNMYWIRIVGIFIRLNNHFDPIHHVQFVMNANKTNLVWFNWNTLISLVAFKCWPLVILSYLYEMSLVFSKVIFWWIGMFFISLMATVSLDAHTLHSVKCWNSRSGI